MGLSCRQTATNPNDHVGHINRERAKNTGFGYCSDFFHLVHSSSIGSTTAGLTPNSELDVELKELDEIRESAPQFETSDNLIWALGHCVCNRICASTFQVSSPLGKRFPPSITPDFAQCSNASNFDRRFGQRWRACLHFPLAKVVECSHPRLQLTIVRLKGTLVLLVYLELQLNGALQVNVHPPFILGRECRFAAGWAEYTRCCC